MSYRHGDTNSIASSTERRRRPNFIADKTGGPSSTNRNAARLNKSAEDADLSVASRSSSRRLPQQGNYLNPTVTSISRNKTSDEILTKLQHQERFGGGASVKSVDGRGSASTRGDGSSVVSSSAASRISKKSAANVDPNASRRYSSSASAYSATRKQKLALDQTNVAVAAVAASDEVSRSQTGSQQHTSKQKILKKKTRPIFHRDPDCCVKVSVRVHPEPDHIPKCIEIRKFSSSWDEDSDNEDDDEFAYNGIRIFDPLDDEKKDQEFNFDHVFDMTNEHDEIYATAVAPLVESSCCQGYNSTILAYGETATGKTFTLLGPAHHNEKTAVIKASSPTNKAAPPKAVSSSASCASSVASSLASFTTYGDRSGDGGSVSGLARNVGIIPRALYSVFRLLEGMKQAIAGETCEFSYSVRVQFLEIYNNEIIDLLSTQLSQGKAGSVNVGKNKMNSKITLRWTGPDPPLVVGAAQPVVSNAEEAWHWLRHGRKRRHTAKTDRNATSSRSHAIFTLLIDQRTVLKTSTTIGGEEMTGQETRSKLNFVDLAAPQRNTSQDNTKMDAARLKEQCDINQSLLTLRLVIRALVEQQTNEQETQGSVKKAPPAKRIPYRDSKLTSVLQGSLGGDHRVAMIACVSPAAVNVEQSWECLKYMNKMQHVENKPASHVDHFSHSSQYSHPKYLDDWSAQSCNSTIQTRLTYSSTKQNYETPSKQPLLGLAPQQQSDANSGMNKLLTPSRQVFRTSSQGTPSPRRNARSAKETSSQTSRQTKESEHRYLTDTSSDDDRSDDWDAALDEILGDDDNQSHDDLRPKIEHVVVVTPSPVGKKKVISTASTADETPVRDDDLIRSNSPNYYAHTLDTTSSYETPNFQKNVSKKSSDAANTTPSTVSPTVTTSCDDFKHVVEIHAGDSLEKLLEASPEYSKNSDSSNHILGDQFVEDDRSTTSSVLTASQLDQKFKLLASENAAILRMRAPLTSEKAWLIATSPLKSGNSSPRKTKPSNVASANFRGGNSDSVNDPIAVLPYNVDPHSANKVAPDVNTSLDSNFGFVGEASVGGKESLYSTGPAVAYVSMGKQNSPRNTSYSTNNSGPSYFFADDNDSSMHSKISLGLESDTANSIPFIDDEDFDSRRGSCTNLNNSLSEKEIVNDSRSLGLEEDDKLLRFLGFLILHQSNDINEQDICSLNDLKKAVQRIFEYRHFQPTSGNVMSVRNSIDDAVEADHACFLKLQKLLQEQKSCCSEKEVEVHHMIGYWVCHSQCDGEADCEQTEDTEMNATASLDTEQRRDILGLIGSLVSRQTDFKIVKSEIEQLLARRNLSLDKRNDVMSQNTSIQNSTNTEDFSDPNVMDAADTLSKSARQQNSYEDSEVQSLIGHWIVKQKRKKDREKVTSSIKNDSNFEGHGAEQQLSLDEAQQKVGSTTSIVVDLEDEKPYGEVPKEKIELLVSDVESALTCAVPPACSILSTNEQSAMIGSPQHGDESVGDQQQPQEIQDSSHQLSPNDNLAYGSSNLVNEWLESDIESVDYASDTVDAWQSETQGGTNSSSNQGTDYRIGMDDSELDARTLTTAVNQVPEIVKDSIRSSSSVDADTNASRPSTDIESEGEESISEKVKPSENQSSTKGEEMDHTHETLSEMKEDHKSFNMLAVHSDSSSDKIEGKSPTLSQAIPETYDSESTLDRTVANADQFLSGVAPEVPFDKLYPPNEKIVTSSAKCESTTPIALEPLMTGILASRVGIESSASTSPDTNSPHPEVENFQKGNKSTQVSMSLPVDISCGTSCAEMTASRDDSMGSKRRTSLDVTEGSSASGYGLSPPAETSANIDNTGLSFNSSHVPAATNDPVISHLMAVDVTTQTHPLPATFEASENEEMLHLASESPPDVVKMADGASVMTTIHHSHIRSSRVKAEGSSKEGELHGANDESMSEMALVSDDTTSKYSSNDVVMTAPALRCYSEGIDDSLAAAGGLIYSGDDAESNELVSSNAIVANTTVSGSSAISAPQVMKTSVLQLATEIIDESENNVLGTSNAIIPGTPMSTNSAVSGPRLIETSCLHRETEVPAELEVVNADAFTDSSTAIRIGEALKGAESINTGEAMDINFSVRLPVDEQLLPARINNTKESFWGGKESKEGPTVCAKQMESESSDELCATSLPAEVASAPNAISSIGILAHVLHAEEVVALDAQIASDASSSLPGICQDVLTADKLPELNQELTCSDGGLENVPTRIVPLSCEVVSPPELHDSSPNDVSKTMESKLVDDPVRLATALEKVKVNIAIRAISKRNIVDGASHSLKEPGVPSSDSNDLMAEPEHDHDCSGNQVLQGKLENVAVLYNESASLSDSSEVDAMLSEFDKALEFTEPSACSLTGTEQKFETIEEKLRLGHDLSEAELTLLEMMLETQSLGNISTDTPPLNPINAKSACDGAFVASVDSVKEVPPPLVQNAEDHFILISKPTPEESTATLELAHLSDDNTLSRVEIERERQRQEEYAEALARTCCSVSCFGRTIEAYFIDYGMDGTNSEQVSATVRTVPKKKRSWMRRVMGGGEKSVIELSPPPDVAILPEDSRREKSS